MLAAGFGKLDWPSPHHIKNYINNGIKHDSLVGYQKTLVCIIAEVVMLRIAVIQRWFCELPHDHSRPGLS
jgi:hypothetical protein